MILSGAKQREFLETLDTINSDAHVESSNKVKTIFILNSSEVEPVTGESPYLRIVELAKLLFKNANILMKAVLKRRSYDPWKPVMGQLAENDIFSGNIRNGTYVLIKKSLVIKFYFKDLNYFEDLYRNVACPNVRSLACNKDYICVVMEKNQELQESLSYENLQKLTSSRVKFLNPTDSISEYYTLRYKITQLFSFYGVNDDSLLAKYLEISKQYEELSRSKSHTEHLCHGDMWAGNIMVYKNHLTLIDLDKVFYFCDLYDIVYYFLMTFEKTAIHNFSESGQFDKKLVTKVSQFIQNKPYDIEFEVYLCIKTMLFIKAVEFNLFNKLLSKDLNYLKIERI